MQQKDSRSSLLYCDAHQSEDVEMWLSKAYAVEHSVCVKQTMQKFVLNVNQLYLFNKLLLAFILKSAEEKFSSVLTHVATCTASSPLCFEMYFDFVADIQPCDHLRGFAAA